MDKTISFIIYVFIWAIPWMCGCDKSSKYQVEASRVRWRVGILARRSKSWYVSAQI